VFAAGAAFWLGISPMASYSASFRLQASSSLAISSCWALFPSLLKSLSMEQCSLCLIQREHGLKSPGPPAWTLHRSLTCVLVGMTW